MLYKKPNKILARSDGANSAGVAAAEAINLDGSPPAKLAAIAQK